MKWLVVISTLIGPALAAGESLDIVTWNLWHGFAPGGVGYAPAEGDDARIARWHRQSAALMSIAPEITVVQECNPLLTRGREIARVTRSTWTRRADSTGVKAFGWGLPRGLEAGLGTFVRQPMSLEDLGAISLSHPRWTLTGRRFSAQVTEERFAQFGAVVTAGGRRVLVVNTQLHDGLEYNDEVAAATAPLTKDLDPKTRDRLARALIRGDRRRARELGFLLARVEELSPRFDVIVVAGDLNASPTSSAAGLMRAAGFRDAWAEAGESGPGLTYDRDANALNERVQSLGRPFTLPAKLELPGTTRATLETMLGAHDARPRRIDYVWIKSRGAPVAVRAARLIAPAGSTSDHFGLRVSLDL